MVSRVFSNGLSNLWVTRHTLGSGSRDGEDTGSKSSAHFDDVG